MGCRLVAAGFRVQSTSTHPCPLRCHLCCFSFYSVSQPSTPPVVLWQFFQNGWEFFDHIKRAYYAKMAIFVSFEPATLEYEFYSIICNFDEVMPYYAHHPVHIVCAKGPPLAETHAGILCHCTQRARNF